MDSKITTAIQEQTPTLSVKSPITPPLSELDPMLIPYLNLPLIKCTYPAPSTFTPSSRSMYYIIHQMDSLINYNSYFTEICNNWHPLLTRLYYGIVFYIQTLRAQVVANVGSRRTRRFVRELLDEIWLESVHIPGPIVPIIEALSVSTSPSNIFGPVTPFIPEQVGPHNISDLLIGSTEHSYELELPNIPSIMYFIESILTADENSIPDYTNKTTFDDTQLRFIYGNQFVPQQWTRIQKDYLLNPVTNWLPETTPDMDYTFRKNGINLGLPFFEKDTNVMNVENFLQLSSSDWFVKLNRIFSTYSKFFKESTTLAECSPKGPECSLVTSNFGELKSANTCDNIYATINTAFCDDTMYTFNIEHISPELKISQPYDAMSQYSFLNLRYLNHNIGRWNAIGTEATRSGPYWNYKPDRSSASNRQTILSIPKVIATKYYMENPSSLEWILDD